MARPQRVEYPGAYYHVINRGNNQEKIEQVDSGQLDYCHDESSSEGAG